MEQRSHRSKGRRSGIRPTDCGYSIWQTGKPEEKFYIFFIDVRWICFIILLNFVLTLKVMELFYCSHI